ncbi:MAG: PLP-dependent transferase, partial [Gammaproteobacteria bacterium]
LLTLLAPGDRVVSLKDTYGGTNRLFAEFLPALGIGVELCTTDDQGAIEAAIDRGTAVLYLESPTNPTCKVVDIARLASRATARG